MAKKTGKGIEKAPSAELSPAVNEPIEGLEGVRPDQIEVPSIRIIQGQTRNKPEGYKLGEFYSPATDDLLGQSIRIIPISMFNTRVLFTPGDFDAPPLCSSADDKFPSSGQSPEDPNGNVHTNCATCHFAQFHPRPDRPDKQYMPCKQMINFFALLLRDEAGDDRQVCRIAFHGTGYATGRRIVNAGYFATPKRALRGTIFELTSKETQGDMGEYFVPKHRQVGLTQELNPDAYAEAGEMFVAWRDFLSRRVTDEAVQEYEEPEGEKKPSAKPDSDEYDDAVPF